MVIKMGGGGGGGGIGAVVLLGGALATAALVSAFAVRHKRRSSGKDSPPAINKKSENIIRKGGEEEVELENDSTVMISDQSLKLDDKAKVETDAENDAVSDDGFVIVKEEIPLLAEKDKVELTKEDVSDDQSKEGDGDGDAEVKEMQPRQEENSQECHDQDNAVEGVQIDQTKVDKSVSMEKKEFEGFCSEEINEEKCVEKTILPQFEGSTIQQDNLVDDKEEAVEMVRADEDKVDNIKEKTVEEHKQCYQSDAGQIQIGGDDSTEVRADKFSFVSKGENGLITHPSLGNILPVMGEVDGGNAQVAKASMQFDGKKIAGDIANGEEKQVEEEMITLGNKVNGGDSCSESNWEALWQAESTKESSIATQQVKLMKYEVGGKILEDRVDESTKNSLIKKNERTDASRWRVIIWMLCVLSSLSCSWFFNLSFAKLCLFMFLTVFLLEIYGYSLLNRHHDYVLQKEIVAMNKASNKLAKI